MLTVALIGRVLQQGPRVRLVIILGLDQGRIPFFTSLTNPEELAEDRRKFYVSLTRARDEVHIYYSGFVEWSTGTIKRDGPSMFLYEIGLLT